MNMLLTIHSYLRWLILIVALIAVIKFTLGWRRGGAFQGMDRGIASGFSGLMDLQATLGIVYMVWNGLAVTGFPSYRIQHAIIMIFAALVAHLPVRWKEADDKTRFRNSLFVILDVLIIVFIGIARLPAAGAGTP
jgi:hypothetical protein